MLNFLAKNINHLRSSRNLNQQHLADLLDVKANTISNYENGKSTPSLEGLMALAAFFQIPVGALIEQDLGSMPHLSRLSEPPQRVVTLFADQPSLPSNPIVPIKARAGYFSTFFQDEKEEIKYVQLPFFKFQGQKRTFEIEGDSMNPVFWEGDFVVCKEVESPEAIKPNRFYVLASRHDGILLKRILIDKERKHYLLLSKNSKYPPIIRHWSEIDEVWEVVYKITPQLELE